MMRLALSLAIDFMENKMRYLVAIIALVSLPAFGSGKDYVPGVLLTGPTSMGTDITTPYFDARGWDDVDLELVVTGTPTGHFFVDCSLNQNPALALPAVAIPLTPAPDVSGSASNIVIELLQIGCPYLRLRYTATSSTGTLKAYYSEKQL